MNESASKSTTKESITVARNVDGFDTKALFLLSSGLYVVSAGALAEEALPAARSGCVVNTVVQVTSRPPRVSVAVNKDNFTSGLIRRAGAFAVTVIDQSADMLFIGNFGFRTGADYDKFTRYEASQTALGMPYTTAHACAMLSCRLVDTVDVGTHLLFIGEVREADRLSENPPLTYDYYHKVLKGKTPPKASSFVPES